MGRLQTFLIALVVVAGAAIAAIAGPGTSTVAGRHGASHPQTPTAPVPVPTPSLPSISWTIEPASSAEEPLLRDFILARIEPPVPGAKWYKLERVTDPKGSEVVEDDPYYPQWFDQREHVFRFTSTRGRRSADDGPIYLRVSGWSEKEKNGGVRISQYSDVLAVHYDHSFERLELDIVVEVDDRRPGEALLRAVPRDPELAAQIELYSWKDYVPEDDGQGGFKFVQRGPPQLTVKPELRISLPEPGVKYVGLFAWNGFYGTALPTLASGLRSHAAPRIDGDFVPLALIVPPEDGPPEQVVPGFTGPVYQLPPIPGDIRFPLLKDAISLFSGGSLFLPLGGAKPITVEVQLPQGVEILDYRPARATPDHSYAVANVSDQVTDGSLPEGYRRYRLLKDRPDRDWSYLNRVLPLYFRFTSPAVIRQEGLFTYLRAYNRPQDEARQDNWQAVGIHCQEIADVPLPRRLRTGVTWADADLFPGPSADPNLDFLTTYRRLGLNSVPMMGSHWRDPAIWPDLYYFPEERTGPEWEAMLYGPEHSTFYTGFHGEGMFSLLKWRVEDMDDFDFSEFNLTPEELEEEKRKWRNALEYYAHPDVTRPDLAYDGVFFWHDLENLATVLEATQPDYIFIDSEDFPTHAQWVGTVSLSKNALARRLPGETDDELANRIAREFLTSLVNTVQEVSPGTKIALYNAAPIYNYGYRPFRWEIFQDLGIVAQPSVYMMERLLDRYGEYLRLSRQALPPGYELIPWITTGTYGEMDPAYVFDVVAHTFLNGATGFSTYVYRDFDDMADYLNMARAIAVVAPYEDIIMDGDLAFDDIGDVENAVVSAMQLDGEYLIAVTPKDTTEPVSFTVHTGQSSNPHILYDLRHGTQQTYASGTVRVTAALGEGTVYRLVPTATPPASQCVRDVNGNGVGDIVGIQATAADLNCLIYLPLVAAQWRQPWPPTNAIVLSDRPSGLELVSAPATLPLSVGHVAYLPVEVQNYHRPLTVSAQTLIHTYVNDLTASQPGGSPPFTVGRLEAAQSELKLQTLRMRDHPLTLSFAVVGQIANLPYTLTLKPAIQPRTPLFGLHSQPFYDGPPEPFIQVWGPNCGSCPTTGGDPPGSTRDILCARQQDSCHCHPILKIRDPDADAHTRHAAPQMQRYASQFLRSVGGWGQVQIEPGQYLWDGLDWVFNDLSPRERDYSPLFTGIIYGNFGWMTCPAYTNPDGSRGFYDPDNAYLLAQYGAYVRELTARYAPELRFIETGNEPSYGFYLCPCIDPGGPPCDATSGPNQPACELGHDSEEFAQVYGPFLSASANVAADGMAEANPDAWLIAGALEKSGADLTATSRYMIEHGLLDRGNVALMIHQFPLLSPNWLAEPVNCTYEQNPNGLPVGCQTAPPFDDYTTPAGRPIHAQDVWRGIDEKIDASLLLHDAEDLGVLDRFTLFDTELHAGFHDNLGGEPNETTTPAREAMLGLRIGAINAHQRYLGLQFIFAPADPTPYNLLVKHLAGATPVYAWDAPLTDADYSGLVYKLFTRGDEDIIAIWSNAERPLELILTPSPGATHFKQVTLTRLADAQGSLAITTTNPSTPPQSIAVQPLREFYFLSVISDRPGFGWLADLEG